MLLPSATTAMDQALLTRAFFMQSSQGSFNPLFTGERERERGFSFLFFLLPPSPALSLFLQALSPSLPLAHSLHSFRNATTTNKKNRKRLHRHGCRRRFCRRVHRVPLLALLLQVAAAQGEDHDPVLPQRRQRRGADQRQLQDADAPGAVKKVMMYEFFFSLSLFFFRNVKWLDRER